MFAFHKPSARLQYIRMDIKKAAGMMGRRSAQARIKKWGKKEFVRRMREWGKLGGRPRKIDRREGDNER
jgi:hypothetical protein